MSAAVVNTVTSPSVPGFLTAYSVPLDSYAILRIKCVDVTGSGATVTVGGQTLYTATGSGTEIFNEIYVGPGLSVDANTVGGSRVTVSVLGVQFTNGF